jgi:outer membrane protein assembly factor BamE (lipoprotein component of BamABCDE complex)
MMVPNSRSHNAAPSLWARIAAGVVAAAIGLSLSGCGDGFTQVYRRGYIVPDGALEQVPLGASQEQVLIVLGTPSTVATVSGEAFYYISQRAEQPMAFLQQHVTNQRVLAVYFDNSRRVERIANYGLKDGKVFDFVSRTTPTGGTELSYLNYIFAIANPLGK